MKHSLGRVSKTYCGAVDIRFWPCRKLSLHDRDRSFGVFAGRTVTIMVWRMAAACPCAGASTVCRWPGGPPAVLSMLGFKA
jgi:hypothetical protein